MSISKYAAWELDRHCDYPKVYLGTVSLGEQCFLIRCRQRVALEEISTALMGIALAELTRMEMGEVPCAALAAYWSERGLL